MAFGIAFAVNMEAAYVFRRARFLAAVITRGAFYLIWHVLYGGPPRAGGLGHAFRRDAGCAAQVCWR